MSNISKEVSETLLKMQLKNIVKKVKDGKTLTAAERKMLDDASDDGTGTEAKYISQLELCDLFGVTRKTIAKWRRERTDIPSKVNGKEDLNEWRSWFAANPDAGYHRGKPRADKETLQCELLEVRVAQARIELAEAQGKVIDLETVQSRDYMIALAMRESLSRMKSDLPPLCEGRDATQLTIVFDDYSRKMMEQLHDLQSPLWKEVEAKAIAAEKAKEETENE